MVFLESSPQRKLSYSLFQDMNRNIEYRISYFFLQRIAEWSITFKTKIHRDCFFHRWFFKRFFYEAALNKDDPGTTCRPRACPGAARLQGKSDPLCKKVIKQGTGKVRYCALFETIAFRIENGERGIAPTTDLVCYLENVLRSCAQKIVENFEQ